MLVGFGQQRLWSPLTFFERVGRAVSDFGFGSLVEKYEEYFGRAVTRAILIVVGLAVVATGVGAIWTWLVSPLLTFFRTPIWGQTLTQLMLTTVAIGGGIALSFSLSQELARLRHVRAIKKMRDEAARDFEKIITDTKRRTGALLAQTEAAHESAELSHAKGNEVMNMAADLFRQIVAAHPQLTEQDRADLISKLDEQQSGRPARGDSD